MLQSRHGAVLEADIHGMTTEQAKRELERLLSNLPRGITEVVVIHGYSHGQALRNMVRVRLRHPRIEAKLLSLNPGQTRILVRKDEP